MGAAVQSANPAIDRTEKPSLDPASTNDPNFLEMQRVEAAKQPINFDNLGGSTNTTHDVALTTQTPTQEQINRRSVTLPPADVNTTRTYAQPTNDGSRIPARWSAHSI